MPTKTTTLLRTPIRYPGGKSRLLKDLIPYLPAKWDEYRESMVGGGSMFWYLRQTYPDRRFWINDLYEDLMHFYLTLSSESETKYFQEIVSGMLRDCSLNWIREHAKELRPDIRFYVLNRCTYSGLTECGGFSQTAYEGRFTQHHIDKLIKYVPLLEGVRISHEDFETTFEPTQFKTFLYLDPPYYGVTGLYKEGNDDFPHQRLADLCKATEHQFMLSYDDVPWVRDTYKWSNIHELPAKYSINHGDGKPQKISHELMITNY